VPVTHIHGGETTQGRLMRPFAIASPKCHIYILEDALLVLMKAGTAPENITILHYNTEYPTPFEDVNLRAMLTIKTTFPGIQVGYSDHTFGIETPIAAVALGARS